MRLIDADALKEKLKPCEADVCEFSCEDCHFRVVTAEDIDNALTVAVNCKDCDGYEAGYSSGLKDAEIPQGDIFPMEIVAGKCPIEVGGNCPLKPQGEWERLNNIKCKCSKCGFAFDDYGILFNFCPNCGAKMKGGAE